MNDEDSATYAEVIGEPISQSKSPVIHGFWLKQLGIAARYGARRVALDELPGYLAQRRDDPDWRGCNVTMPLKQAILPLLDRIEPQAQAIGAVNTVYRDVDGALVGANTDVDGFLEPIADLLAQPHLFRMARIIGTGGAARAIVAALRDHGFTLVLAARNVGKARALLGALVPGGEHFTPPLGHFAKPTDFPFDERENCLDLIINASPLGMRDQAPLEFDISHAPPGSVFYDIVTDPVDTAFLASAREHGFATIGGLGMLIGQAAAAFEKFFGQPPPRELDAQLHELLRA
jgi:shikimate dehydrogenase